VAHPLAKLSIIYDIEDAAKLVLIQVIGHRRDVYRR
jgi:mRNA-degrading endonuclease RelE of RelBE toxin-antitoxin system